MLIRKKVSLRVSHPSLLLFFSDKETFRVYIVLPLLPGFDNVNAVQAVLYFIMRSISKGDCSLFKRLEKAGQ